MDPNHSPHQHRQKRFAPERNQIINDEIDKLLEVGFNRDMWYLTWISNLLVVTEKHGKWRVYVIDYTNLNKACPKYCSSLTKIDHMVDVTTGYELLIFLDVYSRYNKIPMAIGDHDKTTFITQHGLYCYTVILFDLKNAGSTYRRLVNRIQAKRV